MAREFTSIWTPPIRPAMRLEFRNAFTGQQEKDPVLMSLIMRHKYLRRLSRGACRIR